VRLFLVQQFMPVTMRRASCMSSFILSVMVSIAESSSLPIRPDATYTRLIDLKNVCSCCQSLFPNIHQWYKFGENPSSTYQDIVLTRLMTNALTHTLTHSLTYLQTNIPKYTILRKYNEIVTFLETKVTYFTVNCTNHCLTDINSLAPELNYAILLPLLSRSSPLSNIEGICTYNISNCSADNMQQHINLKTLIVITQV